MQKTALNTAVALALATFGAGAAFAQSSLTLYGSADVSVDHVKKTAGTSLLTGTTGLPPLGGATSAQATAGKASNVTRVSPSASSQTSFGLKGEENLGDGYKASFVLEGQLNHDTGLLGQDGRLFGRQAYVGVTTPFGEVRLGRQYAPIFYSTAVITGERFGATDLFIEGGATNNLMVRQDNQISYWLKAGGLTASVAFSPNAGSVDLITAARGGQVSGVNGSILGGLTSGQEQSGTKNGRSVGLFANYAFDESFNMAFGYHQNDFDRAQFGLYEPSMGTVLATSAFTLDSYKAANLGAKYIVPGSNIMLSGTIGQGQYDTSSVGLKVQFVAIGLRVPVNAWTFSAQASQIKFKNFTKGKDTGVMLGAEYALSKRTSLFARAVQIKDDEGQSADVGFGPAIGGIQGGPNVIATTFGFRETPVFAGAGINAGGKSTYLGAGIRHTF